MQFSAILVYMDGTTKLVLSAYAETRPRAKRAVIKKVKKLVKALELL